MLELALNLLLGCLLLAVVLATFSVALAGLLRLERHENWLRWSEVDRRPLLNLPGALLSRRLRTFRVDTLDEQTGLRRVYSYPAKHAGAARMKARHWGMHAGEIAEQAPPLATEH